MKQFKTLAQLSIAAIFAFLAFSAYATCLNTNAQTTTLLSAVTSTGAGTCYKFAPGTSGRSAQVVVAGSGVVSATTLLEVSDDGTNYVTAATFTSSGTTTATDGIQTQNSWTYMRGNVSAISGTSAAVTLNVGTGN